MKQVLSVADFAVMLNLVDEELSNLQRRAIINSCYVGDSERVAKHKQEEALKQLQATPYYQTLAHLKESLQNLNIEVECPDVEIQSTPKE